MSRRTTEVKVDPKKVLGSRIKISFLGISASEVLYTNTEVSGDSQLRKMSELEYFPDSGFCRTTQEDTVFFL